MARKKTVSSAPAKNHVRLDELITLIFIISMIFVSGAFLSVYIAQLSLNADTIMPSTPTGKFLLPAVSTNKLNSTCLQSVAASGSITGYACSENDLNGDCKPSVANTIPLSFGFSDITSLILIFLLVAFISYLIFKNNTLQTAGKPKQIKKSKK